MDMKGYTIEQFKELGSALNSFLGLDEPGVDPSLPEEEYVTAVYEALKLITPEDSARSGLSPIQWKMVRGLNFDAPIQMSSISEEKTEEEKKKIEEMKKELMRGSPKKEKKLSNRYTRAQSVADAIIALARVSTPDERGWYELSKEAVIKTSDELFGTENRESAVWYTNAGLSAYYALGVAAETGKNSFIINGAVFPP